MPVAILGIMKEVPAVVAVLQNSPLVLLTLVSIAAFAVVGLTILVLGKK